MKQLKLLAWIGALLLAFGVAACKKNDALGSVDIRFNHRVGAEALELTKMKYQAQAGHIYSVERLKYYVSNVTLHAADGSVVQAEGAHYREEGLEETAVLSLREVPNGKYTLLTFVLGLDETMNKPKALPNTLQNINMEWPMPGEEGYHYMKFEGKYDIMGTGVIKPFNLHTGATNNIPHYVTVSLPIAELQMNRNDWLITLEMDLNEWLQNPHTVDFEQLQAGIMADEPAQQMLKENGSSLFNVASVKPK